MDCVFCEIVRGKLPAAVVFEDQESLAFLDNRPLFPGHVLLIPRTHCETLGDLPPASVGPLFGVAQRLAQAVEGSLGADGTFVAINNRVSQSVPHLHVHVVPRRKKDGMKGFFWPRNPYASQQDLEEVQRKIRAAMAQPTRD